MKKILLLLFFFSFEICNAQQWFPLGTGLIGSGQYDRVNTLCNDSIHNRLWAAGIFQIAGGDSVHNVAWWDGINWHPLQSFVVGGDTLEYGLDMEITSSIMFHNKLLFSIDKSLALNRWLIFELNEDSISNRFVGSFNKDINAMCIYHDTLYVAGEFTNYQSVPAGTTINVNRIAKWNGTDFVPLGSGIGAGGIVYDLCVYNDKLIAAGYFETAGGTYCKNIAAWDGTSWSAIGNGIGLAGTLDDKIYELCPYKGKLYAGGLDISITNNDLLVWDGNNWSGVSNQFNYVGALVVFKNKLYVGAGNTNLTPPFNFVAVFNDTAWNATGQGPSGGSSPVIKDFAIFNNELYTGGTFHYIGDSPIIYAGYVARFDPTTIDTTGIEINKSNENEISIYPNPTDNQLTIESSKTINTIEISDALGREIYQSKINLKAEIINLKSFASGIYFIKLYFTDGSMQVKKFVKE